MNEFLSNYCYWSILITLAVMILENVPYFPLRVENVLQDWWIGIYWKHEPIGGEYGLIGGYLRLKYKITVYLCLVPCWPIIWERIYFKNSNTTWADNMRQERLNQPRVTKEEAQAQADRIKKVVDTWPNSR